MQFINMKELIFQNNGFEVTKIDHMNYSNPISTGEFNKVVDKLVKDLSGNEENKNTVMKTPMSESKVVLICYNNKGIIIKILIVYITDVQDKFKKEEPVKQEEAVPVPCYNGVVEEDSTEFIYDVIKSNEFKDQFNPQTKAIMIGHLIASKIDEKKIQNMLELGKQFIK